MVINLCEHGYYVNLNLDVNFRRQKSGTLEQDIPRPTCRSVYTVSDKHLRHGGSGYETIHRPHALAQHPLGKSSDGEGGE